jgi:endoglucanase
LLRSLLTAPGPSGYEAAPSAVWREAASSFAEVSSDTLGSSIARVRGTGDGPLLAFVGHIDEIGLIVTHVDKDGFVFFRGVGGWSAEVLRGQRLELLTKDGAIPGTVERAQRKPKKGGDPQPTELDDLHIDIGAKDGDEAKRLVRPGDVAVIAGDPVEFPNGRVASRSLDNRLGAYVALEALRRVHERGGFAGQMAAVAAVQEEIGSKGAATTAFSLEPDLAIAIDGTHATDAPGVEEKELGRHPLGSGPVIGRGSTLSPRIFELLSETAERLDAPHSVEASGRATWTDADAIQIARGGIPAGLISIPVRYMHSPVEMVDLADVEATIELVAAFALALEPGLDLSR